jgi:hypothetical protein
VDIKIVCKFHLRKNWQNKKEGKEGALKFGC